MALECRTPRPHRRPETAGVPSHDCSAASSPPVRDATDGRTLASSARADWALRAGCAPCDPFACCERCWARWVRARLLEHWHGERYWAELDRGDFALLQVPVHPNTALLAEIVALVAEGEENLAIIGWAVETARPLEDVLSILTALDLNGRRLRRFAWLSRPTHRCTRR